MTRSWTPRHPGEPALRVAVVGGGAAGVITAVHLLREATPERPVDVRVVERGPRLGPGLAYGQDHPRLTVNNYAGRLSALADEPDHLLQWCASRGRDVGPTDFPRRAEYGAYLNGLLDEVVVPAGSALGRVRGVATDVVDTSTALEVTLTGGWSVAADVVVLALGNPPPRAYPGATGHPGYVADPWTPDLAERLDGASEVLLLGTGHTMVDVVGQLQEAMPMARFTAVSREGRLPATHRRTAMPLHETFEPDVSSLDALLDQVERRVRQKQADGGDWRDVLDSVRAAGNDIWQALSPDEQRRFVSEVSRTWERLRHRISPDLADFVAAMQRSSRLRVLTVESVDLTQYDAVVNCTGPAPVQTRGWNRLVDTLLDRGTIRGHQLGLGLDLDPRGHVVTREGVPHPRIVAVGAARKGLEWEVGAIPDLRTQAATVARGLLGTSHVVRREVGADSA